MDSWEQSLRVCENILAEKAEIIIQTIKDKQEKYGRYLALVYIKVAPEIVYGLADIRKIKDYFCLNDILVSKGLAKEYMI